MLASITKHGLAAALVAVTAALGGCVANRPAQTTTTSVTTPRPDATGVSSRTIDNAGFVDNGGRTSDETSRTLMSGMRATEVGSERITGTPGSGTPVPIPPSALPRNVGEVLEGGRWPTASPRGELGTTSGSGPSPETIGRLARARCDRETACHRVGEGLPSPTQESCVAEQRERVNADFAPLTCARGLDRAQLAACLNAVRLQPCGDVRAELDVLPECRSIALCAE